MIFLTGCTGFLGRELLGRLLVARPTERFCLLVRPSKKESGEQRVKGLLKEIFGEQSNRYLDRIEIVEGDVSEDRFGLGESAFCELAERVDTVFHCAASTSLGDSIELCRQSNVRGTREVLALSRSSQALRGDCRLHHVSTAFVAGDRQDIVKPDELHTSGSFKNAYEQSKAEAEALVRAEYGRIRTNIYRPSIIVGDSVTGQTSAFNVIYIPARYLASGLISMLPGRPNTPIDVVPVDYVADAIVALSGDEAATGGCFHLCSGVGREATLREIVEHIVRAVNNYARANYTRVREAIFRTPEIVAPEMIHLAQASLGLLKQIWHLLPYMSRNPRFDIGATTRMLHGVLNPPPLFDLYAPQMFAYCLETNWGKRTWQNPAELKSWIHRINHFA